MGAIQIVLIASLGWFALAQMAKIGHEIKEISNDHLPLTAALTLITEHQLQQTIALEKVISHELLDAVKGQGESPETRKLVEELEYKIKKLHDEIVETDALIVNLEKEVSIPESKVKYQALYAEYIKVEQEFFQLEEETNAFLKVIKTDGILKALDKIKRVEDLNHSLDEHLIAVLNDVQTYSIDAANTAYQDEQDAIVFISLGLALAILLSLIIPFIIGRSVILPLQELLSRLEDRPHH